MINNIFNAHTTYIFLVDMYRILQKWSRNNASFIPTTLSFSMLVLIT